MKGGAVMKNNVIFVDFTSRRVKVKLKCKVKYRSKNYFSLFLAEVKKLFFSKNKTKANCQVYTFKHIM